jgi:3-hydroxyacyl-CoA dehydrogenase
MSKPIRKAAVLGAGVMGAQVAAHLANAGVQVLLLDLPAKEGDRNAYAKGALKKLGKQKPPPLFSPSVLARITPGNFDDHMPLLSDVDWVVEAVIENLDIKRSLFTKVAEHASDDAIISTNTSGLPIHLIAAELDDSIQRRFLGTHFFNPPRYLKLLELIPTEDTDPEVLERIAAFGRVHLGKGPVVAKDTPNFIGNRIGIYSLLRCIARMGEYSIEEIDLLTGTLIGRPKSATFRTADVVGLDVLMYVAKYLHGAVTEDESRDAFAAPELLLKLVESGALGAKSRKGFYQKVGSDILSVNAETLEYEARAPMDLDNCRAIKRLPLKERFQALFADDSRAGAFFRDTTLELLAYCARRVPEITDNPGDLDKAMRWGFGWELGPFEIWDALGIDTVATAMADAGIDLPDWVDGVGDSFYRASDHGRDVYSPSGVIPVDEPADEYTVADVAAHADSVLRETDGSRLLDMGRGVALFEFRTKAHIIGSGVINDLFDAIDTIEGDDHFVGMVIGNDGPIFSAGANLGEMVGAVQAGQIGQVDKMIQRFQGLNQRICYASKPIVAATQGVTVGGGCEIAMACDLVVAAGDTYLGLVELGVGLIPAGGGTMRAAQLAGQRAAGEAPHLVFPFLRTVFESIAMGKTSTSAPNAVEMGLLRSATRVVMNTDRRLYVAADQVVRLANEGYKPPCETPVRVLGRPAASAFDAVVYNMKEGRFVSEYDQFLARKLSHVITGGDLSGPAWVSEQYVLDLEREAFMSLLGETKTHARIESILTTNKPLRN